MDYDGSNDKPRLTAEQKKKNHIESEKKRRDAIRQGFQKLADIVPGVHGQARSEAVVLEATVKHVRDLVAEKEAMKKKAMAKGMSEGDFEQVYRDLDTQEKRVAAGLQPDFKKIAEEEEEPESPSVQAAASSKGKKKASK